MKRLSLYNPYLILLIAAISCFMASCGANQRQFLAIDAASIKAGESMDAVLTGLGPPDARKRLSPTHEAWYYYYVNKRFYQKTPLIGGFLGKGEIETLEIKFLRDKVEAATFYVVGQK